MHALLATLPAPLGPNALQGRGPCIIPGPGAWGGQVRGRQQPRLQARSGARQVPPLLIRNLGHLSLKYVRYGRVDGLGERYAWAWAWAWAGGARAEGGRAFPPAAGRCWRCWVLCLDLFGWMSAGRGCGRSVAAAMTRGRRSLVASVLLLPVPLADGCRARNGCGWARWCIPPGPRCRAVL